MTFVLLSLENMIPEEHLLKIINQIVDFQFIYELATYYYSAKGRPSIDPVIMVKLLLFRFLYGIKSERRLMEEIQLNLAYRWFCGLDDDESLYRCRSAGQCGEIEIGAL